MDMKLEHKEAFTVIGFSAHIRPDEGYIKCPEFWDKEYAQKYKRLFETGKPETPEEKAVCDNHIGMLALCIDGKDGFEYMICGVYEGGDVPDGMKLYSFPESDWAVFCAKGPLPGSLQQLNNEVWQKWYPTEGQAYLPNGTATVEYYSAGDPTSPDYGCGMWIPVVSKMIAPCGLDCTKCDAYIATVNDDNALREKTAKLWAEANNAPITPDMINCRGCRGDGVKTPYCESMCEIRKCAIEKKHDFCARCADVDKCVNMGYVLENSEEARDNLKKLR